MNFTHDEFSKIGCRFGFSQKAPTFEREDWSLFRTLEGLQQRAGVPKNMLSRLVLKELADNGLDNGAEVTVQSLPDKSGYVVEDDGTGINGVPEDPAAPEWVRLLGSTGRAYARWRGGRRGRI